MILSIARIPYVTPYVGLVEVCALLAVMQFWLKRPVVTVAHAAVLLLDCSELSEHNRGCAQVAFYNTSVSTRFAVTTKRSDFVANELQVASVSVLPVTVSGIESSFAFALRTLSTA